MPGIRVVTRILATAMAGITAATVAAAPALADTGAGALAGAVRDTQGAVVADAEITVYPPDTSGNHVARTRTDAAGRFRVPGLEAGSYKILIGLGGWSEWAPGRTDDVAEAVAYRIAAGRTTIASSIVTAPGVITGRLTTPAGTPATGIPVSVDDERYARVWHATTAADGSYTLRVPPGSSYVVSFVDGNLRQYSPRTVDFSAATRYSVRSGRTLRVDERLLEAASLTGRLVDAAGAPVAAAQVSVYTLTATELRATTGADGRYRFDKLAPGAVKVAFTLADGRVQWAHQKLSYEEADEVVLQLGAVATVDDQLLPIS